MGGPRGTAFARYLRKVHVEWCPFKPRAVGPIFFSELHSTSLLSAIPKLSVSKSIARRPHSADAPFVDRAQITFACGTERTLDFTGLKLSDVMEEIDMENARIVNEERTRGRPF